MPMAVLIATASARAVTQFESLLANVVLLT